MAAERTVAEQHATEVVAMRYWLLGQGYNVAAQAFEVAKGLHVGLRKDKVSPAFSHPLFVASYVRTLLPGLAYKEASLATAFLHDVCEDYGVTYEQIVERFGADVERPVRLLTKKYQGITIPYDVYFGRIAEDPVASIAKAADRAHNILTMSGTDWSLEKQTEYVDELDRWFLPMIKAARRRFPEQEMAYENVKTLLVVQAKHIRLSLERAYAMRATLEDRANKDDVAEFDSISEANSAHGPGR